jgi:hypothetical protein
MSIGKIDFVVNEAVENAEDCKGANSLLGADVDVHIRSL